MPGHVSHCSGRDLDVGLYARSASGVRNAVQRTTTSTLAVDVTRTFFEALVATGVVRYIFLDRGLIERLRAEGISPALSAVLAHVDGHANHAHIRVQCAPDDPHCQP